jgi:hypothetical protein
MMIVHRKYDRKDSIIHKLHRMNLVTHMFKVQNVKVVAHDVIVNVLERVRLVSLVRYLFFHNSEKNLIFLLFFFSKVNKVFLVFLATVV